MATTQGWIAREEALARLGVKSQTLYAYVSRGRIAARPDPSDPRRSQYALRDIARLIQGEAGPPAVVMRAPARGEADLRSSVSVAQDGRLFYRGRDAAQLADHATLEATARILWDAPENPFAGVRPRVDAVGGARPRQRLFAALARRAVEDGSSRGKDASALRGAAASLLNEAVDAVAGPGPRLHFHQRLARGWKVADRDHDLIRRALVLAADTPQGDELTAARVAAAAGASLAGAALAGMVTLAARPTIQAAETAASAIVQARRNPSAPDIDPDGELDMGDPVWPGADPRAQALLAAAALPPELEAVRLRAEAGAGRPASLAFALALLGRRLDLPREAVLDLLLVARLSGLLAHAMDQVTDGSPIRSRLRYVGPEPGAN